jgi:hypothetical protein
MPDVNFHVDGAEAVRFAAAPLLVFKLRVTNSEGSEPIHTIVLRCQIQIEANRRRYSPQDQERLLDLFGKPERWSQTLRSMLWTFTNVSVPTFTDSVVVDLPVPCTFDFNVAAAKYFYGLEDGEVPLKLMFSGTILYESDDGTLQVTQILWDKEADYRLPIRVWQEMMDHYYPNCAWLSVRRDIFDRLYQYKVQQGMPTWEQVLESLLPIREQ